MNRLHTAAVATAVLTVFVGNLAHAQMLEALTRPQPGRSMRVTSGNSLDNSDSQPFAIGECKTIALLRGPGKIAHIWEFSDRKQWQAPEGAT